MTKELFITILLAVIASGGAWYAAFLGRKKTQSEQHKLDVESDKITVEYLTEALTALRNENAEIRKEIKQLTHEVQLFKKAFNGISVCEHRLTCPAHAILYGETGEDK